ncbi:hypothetical protein GLUCORHAEAF1_05510 [Komagataeibacter rhaeticus AF1]|nr:hypothetical protein GLUCORHAEAF1_05510 [Komagataeibacter rhaeticus AF1]
MFRNLLFGYALLIWSAGGFGRRMYSDPSIQPGRVKPWGRYTSVLRLLMLWFVLMTQVVMMLRLSASCHCILFTETTYHSALSQTYMRRTVAIRCHIWEHREHRLSPQMLQDDQLNLSFRTHARL